MTKTIKLSNGLHTLVDDDMYEYLANWNWNFDRGYVRRWSTNDEGKRQMIHMHRVVLSPKEGFDIDHINGDGLDNRRRNLRYATRSQNNMNRFARHITKYSPYKGVCWRPIPRRWKSYIKINKKQIHLGYFSTAEEAAKAYNNAAIKYFGEFANLNTVQDKTKTLFVEGK
jgi:hypothetical protein